jgi:hypothetical protein
MALNGSKGFQRLMPRRADKQSDVTYTKSMNIEQTIGRRFHDVKAFFGKYGGGAYPSE